MRESEIKTLIGKGGGRRVEFKQCKTALSKEVYETVCAFLNRLGGELLLGVSDEGERRENVDRYDDRDDIRTNLIESYDRLLSFGEKHLNDPFYLENDQCISLRGKILREVISNLLIHREYTNAFPAKFIIEKEKIQTENGNKPHGLGPINPERLTPFPKNPSIARVFKEIGRADELGSGTRNLFKYCRAYCGNDPQLIEEDIFRFVLPLTPQATQQDEERTKIILEFCKTPKNRGEIQKLLGLKDREYFRSEVLKPLIEQGLLHPTISNKLTSPKQRYYSMKPRDKKNERS
ncbi:MAG: putative DNA binding domain-containing protein [Elusimicrobia bacterium]|nr:putative DNA binding domain-containing protein [Elusimicrobiota bacterium]